MTITFLREVADGPTFWVHSLSVSLISLVTGMVVCSSFFEVSCVFLLVGICVFCSWLPFRRKMGVAVEKAARTGRREAADILRGGSESRGIEATDQSIAVTLKVDIAIHYSFSDT